MAAVGLVGTTWDNEMQTKPVKLHDRHDRASSCHETGDRRTGVQSSMVSTGAWWRRVQHDANHWWGYARTSLLLFVMLDRVCKITCLIGSARSLPTSAGIWNQAVIRNQMVEVGNHVLATMYSTRTSTYLKFGFKRAFLSTRPDVSIQSLEDGISFAKGRWSDNINPHQQ